MEDFNKETALNELLGMFKGCENVGFTEVLKMTEKELSKVISCFDSMITKKYK